ncbi:prepilin-type N-terminal cleavage/methylation domain-containing protein [Desulfobacterales bacterium HSG16]|nr:prepilin-type N-terminal cleavage/methylation domain-containing protein [Desulfobacterales bacterium HSG16]
MMSSKDKKGFTLIELLVVMLITLIVMTGIYSTYMTQQKAYIVQEQISEMQQNLRVSMYQIERDFRMAGFSSEIIDGDIDGIMTAASSEFEFDRRIIGGDDDGDEQTIKYFINATSSLGEDTLSRTSTNITDGKGPGTEPIAQNIEVVDLTYIYDDGSEAIPSATDFDPGKICSVQVTLVAKVAKEDLDYKCVDSFTDMQGDEVLAPPDDHYRRRSLSKHIKFRNLCMGQ